MRELLRTIIAVVVGLATLVVGQLILETVAWWWVGDTATFDDPLLNVMKFGIAGAAGFIIAASIIVGSKPRGRLAQARASSKNDSIADQL